MSDEQIAVDAVDSTETVGSAESAVGATDAGVAEAEPFFTWKGDDGEETAFHKPAELADFLRHSGMRKKDYDAALGKVNERSKYLEDQIRGFETKDRRIAELLNKYEAIDQMMVSNPDFDKAVRALHQRFKGTPQQSADPKDLVRQVVQEELKPLQEWKSEKDKADEERKAQESRAAAFRRLKERYEDADESLLEKEMKRLQDIPPQDAEFAIMELLHHAVRGRETPAELERRMAAGKRRPPSVTSTPGKTSGDGDDIEGLPIEEIRKRAEATLAKMGTPK